MGTKNHLGDPLFKAAHFATLAPSIFNTQPWLFYLSEDSIQIYPDLSRHLGFLDPDQRALHMSLGCALENAVIALRQFQLETEVSIFSHPRSEDAIRVDVSHGKSFKPSRSSFAPEDWIQVIQKRTSNVKKFENRAISPQTWARLESVLSDEGVQIRMLTHREDIFPWINWVVQADRIQFNDPRFQEELLSWTRFSESEVRRFRDGLRASDLGIPSGIRWLGSFFLRNYHFADFKARRDEELIKQASGLVLFLTKSELRDSWIKVGRTLQRWTLAATHLGIQHRYLNQVLEVPELKAMLQENLDLPGLFPQAVLAVGYGIPGVRSVRRALDEVLLQTPFLAAAS